MSQPRFAIGDCVRVRQGVTDFDYADMPLGGWAGVVVETEEGAGTTCLVRWSRETLAMIGHVYVDRSLSEADGILCAVQDEGGTGRLPLGSIQVDPSSPAYQFVDDYRYWYSNGR